MVCFYHCICLCTGGTGTYAIEAQLAHAIYAGVWPMIFTTWQTKWQRHIIKNKKTLQKLYDKHMLCIRVHFPGVCCVWYSGFLTSARMHLGKSCYMNYDIVEKKFKIIRPCIRVCTRIYRRFLRLHENTTVVRSANFQTHFHLGAYLLLFNLETLRLVPPPPLQTMQRDLLAITLLFYVYA